MLDIGRCEVLIGCVGASQLCKVASIFCMEANTSFMFSILAVWSGVVGFGEGGRRCGLYLLSPVKNFWKRRTRASFLSGCSFLNLAADWKNSLNLVLISPRASRAGLESFAGGG